MFPTVRHHTKIRTALAAVLVSVATLAGAHSATAATTTYPADSLVGRTTNFESLNIPGMYMRHQNYLGELTTLTNTWDRNDASFVVRRGLNGTPGSVSFESTNFPGLYLRHQYFRIKLAARDGSSLFDQDATFMPRPQATRSQWRFESVNAPGRFIRHQNFDLWLAASDGSTLFQQDSTWWSIPITQPCANTDVALNQYTTATVAAATACLINQERVGRGLVPLVPAVLEGTDQHAAVWRTPSLTANWAMSTLMYYCRDTILNGDLNTFEVTALPSDAAGRPAVSIDLARR